MKLRLPFVLVKTFYSLSLITYKKYNYYDGFGQENYTLNIIEISWAGNSWLKLKY